MGEAILIYNKIDLKLKSVKRDKEGYFILVAGKIRQEEIPKQMGTLICQGSISKV